MQDALFLGGSVSTWGNAPPPSPRENSYQEYMEEWHMKKVLAFTMSLVLLLALTACNKQQSQQPDTSQQEPEPTINQVEPETAQATANQLSQTEQKQNEENILQGDELIEAFQDTYDGCMGYSFNKDEQIQYEISELTSHKGFYESKSGKAYPADYAEQYIEWRPLANSLDDSAKPASSEGTSNNQTATPTEAVQSPSDSGSQAQGGETPASGGNPSGWIDPSTQTIDHTQTQLEGGTKIREGTTIHSYDPETGWGSAGGLGEGVHVG